MKRFGYYFRGLLCLPLMPFFILSVVLWCITTMLADTADHLAEALIVFVEEFAGEAD